MRTIDYVQIVWKKIFRTKKNIYIFLQFILCGIFLMAALTFKDNFNNLISNTLSKNIGFRSLSVTVKTDKDDLGQNEIENLDHVLTVYSSKYDSLTVKSSFESEISDGTIDLLYGDSKILPDVINGKSFSDNDTGVAICPAKFYPSSSAYNLFINENNIIDGKSLIGQTFKTKYYSYKYVNGKTKEDKEYNKDFKIIGVYNSENSMNTFNSCYVSSRDIKSMQTNTENVKGQYYNLIVVVDNINNVSSVKNKIEELGFLDASVRNELDNKTVQLITLFCNIIVTVILTTILIITISYIKKKMINESNNIAVMKACGFENSKVIKIIALEQLIINIISYLISILIFIILFIILKFTIFKMFNIPGFNISLFANCFLTSFLYLVVVIMIIDIIYIIRFSKKSIVKMIRSKE